MTTAGEHLVPPVIQAFCERHPEIEISLDVGNREDVFGALFDHEADVAITGRVPDDEPHRGPPDRRERVRAGDRPRRPAVARPWVAIEELASRPWLVREPGSGTRKLCEEYLAAAGLAPRLRTLGSNGAIKQAARAGLGIALQSRAAVALELDLGILAGVRPRGGLPRRHWHVVRSAVGPARADVDAFIDFLGSPAGRLAIAQGLGMTGRD